MYTQANTLSDWLQYISELHPADMVLGLERVQSVADNLKLTRPAPTVITVAGTNGKGSCISSMEQILCEQGHQVGAYTSPHIERFNERIRINGEEVNDATLCAAFATVEQARCNNRNHRNNRNRRNHYAGCNHDDSCEHHESCDIAITYFEFTTLAALLLFQQHKLEVVLLEVGLGGRLDAVNLVAPDVSVITSIALDHQEWLGDSVDAIAREKAGIMRQGRPVVLADVEMPKVLHEEAAHLQCPVFQIGSAYNVLGADSFDSSVSNLSNARNVSNDTATMVDNDEGSETWQWQGNNGALRYDHLPRNNLLLANQAAAMQALLLAGFILHEASLRRAMKRQPLPGRFERRSSNDLMVPVILDVAHNPAASQLCAARLKKLADAADTKPIIAVLAVMADKDIEGMIRAFSPVLDICYIAHFANARCMPIDEAVARCRQAAPKLDIRPGGSVIEAYHAALAEYQAGGAVVVAGSFMTVAAIRPLTHTVKG
ncbi:MAG: bifunctional folylpolyglutamate synthase/dihydrofolate synthase [Pseudohongiellaceae bacterium]